MSSPQVPLGEICQFIGGGTPSKKVTRYFGGSIPWATVKDFKGFRVSETAESITEQAVSDSATNIVDAGTVLLVTRVGLGKVAIADRRLAINQDIKGLTPNSRVLPEYLFWFLVFKAPEIERMGVGATVKGVTLQDLRAIKIPVPLLDDQRRIVDLLSRAEGIVRLRREAQQKAAELIPAIFIDMFGDPASNPDTWPRHPLSAMAEVISGVAKGRKLEPAEAVELPYMRVANVKDGYLDLTEVKTIEIKRSEVEKLLIRPGDLLMTEGGDPDKLGRAALWTGELEACVHQNHVFKVRSDDARLSPAYLRALAGSPYGKAYFLSVAKKTTGIASINKTQLSAFPVPLPPLPLQRTFERRVMAVESILSQQVDAAEKAKASFQSLLSSAFGT
ncbi:MAG: HsdS1 [Pseudomonadota bacterium]|jgi:type I restriction enzyme S subunit